MRQCISKILFLIHPHVFEELLKKYCVKRQLIESFDPIFKFAQKVKLVSNILVFKQRRQGRIQEG